MYELRSLVIFTFLLITAGCANNTPILLEPATSDTSRFFTQENVTDMQITQQTQNKTQPIMHVEKDISEEELNERASFSLLWPTYLPEGFSF